MPNIKSAEKRVMVIKRNTERNRAVKASMRTVLKKFSAAVTANDSNADALFVQAASAVDKAASKGVIHKNKANRKKAQLARMLAAK